MIVVEQQRRVSIRSGFKQPKELDADVLRQKQGTVAEVLAEICRQHLGDEALSQELHPGKVDIELSSEGPEGEGTEERALELSADWQQKVVPLIEANEHVELGVARHVDGGVSQPRPLSAQNRRRYLA